MRFYSGLLVLMCGLTCLMAVAAQPAEPQDDAPRSSVIVHLHGPITPQLEHYVYRSLEKAQRTGADVVILDIDSPGGLVGASLRLAHHFEAITWAEAVAYVPREALSGAAIVAIGCDKIVLHPRARIGNAGPIFLGEDALFRHAPEKVRSDLAQQMRILAESQNRPPTLAEAMVDMDLQVFEVRNKSTDEIRYLSEREIAALENPDEWEKGRPIVESGNGRFLELTGSRAVLLGLADLVVDSREQLFEKMNLEPPLRVIKPGTVDAVVFWLNRPLITGLLFVVGLVALYFEFSAPGIGLGGLTAGLCFALFFWSRFLGGTAGWLEVILFLAGVTFLGFELFVLPGFGISGIAGIVLVFTSLILASQEYLIPHTVREWERTAVSLAVLVGSGFLFLGIAAVLARHFGRLPIISRLALSPPEANEVDESLDGAKKPSPYTTAYRVAVGDWGTADSPLRPAGKALFGDEYVDVVADGTFVEAGRPVKVVRISGNRIVVREVEEAPGATFGQEAVT